jgi:hypothetical protein
MYAISLPFRIYNIAFEHKFYLGGSISVCCRGSGKKRIFLENSWRGYYRHLIKAYTNSGLG